LDPKLRDANRKQYNQQLNQLHQTLDIANQEETVDDVTAEEQQEILG
jgi:hypothetical protein